MNAIKPRLSRNCEIFPIFMEHQFERLKPVHERCSGFQYLIICSNQNDVINVSEIAAWNQAHHFGINVPKNQIGNQVAKHWASEKCPRATIFSQGKLSFQN